MHHSIIVVGESGTGKSTFINNLFHAYAGWNLLVPGRSGGGTSTPADLFRRAPEELCTIFTVENDEEREKIHYARLI